MLRYTDAQQIILALAHSFGKEKIALEDATGRVLSEKIYADRDYPPFNRSAMDGFAMKLDDLQMGVRQFRSIETIYAGQENEREIGSGQCFKIMTGAAVPQEANIVIRKEDTDENGELISIHIDKFKPFQNIAKRGEDLCAGKLVIEKNCVCTAPVISLLAAIGKPELTVERWPKIAIITTGNEVMNVDSRVSAVQIRNSNSALLNSLIKKQYGIAAKLQHVQDDPRALRKAFEEVMDYDIIISSGGVSAGDADYVPVVLQQLGMEKLFHKTAIKPGKPFWCGKKPNDGLVFALPGNPLSCLVTFTIFIRPFLQSSFGLPVTEPLQYFLDGERSKQNELDEFFPVRFKPNTNQLETLPFNGSGDIQAALFADGIALHPFDCPTIKQEPVSYFSL